MRPRIAKATASGASVSMFGTGAWLMGTGAVRNGSPMGRVGLRTDIGGLAAIGAPFPMGYPQTAKEFIVQHANGVPRLSV